MDRKENKSVKQCYSKILNFLSFERYLHKRVNITNRNGSSKNSFHKVQTCKYIVKKSKGKEAEWTTPSRGNYRNEAKKETSARRLFGNVRIHLFFVIARTNLITSFSLSVTRENEDAEAQWLERGRRSRLSTRKREEGSADRRVA